MLGVSGINGILGLGRLVGMNGAGVRTGLGEDTSIGGSGGSFLTTSIGIVPGK